MRDVACLVFILIAGYFAWLATVEEDYEYNYLRWAVGGSSLVISWFCIR